MNFSLINVIKTKQMTAQIIYGQVIWINKSETSIVITVEVVAQIAAYAT